MRYCVSKLFLVVLIWLLNLGLFIGKFGFLDLMGLLWVFLWVFFLLGVFLKRGNVCGLCIIGFVFMFLMDFLWGVWVI